MAFVFDFFLISQSSRNKFCNTDLFFYSLMEQQKAALVEALCRKGSAMCRIYTIMNAAASEGEEDDEQEELSTDAPIEVSLESIDNMWRDVLRFTDANDTKVYISCYVYI